VRQAQNAQNTAALTVALRESEKATADATVDQRQAELSAADRRFKRTEALAKTNVVTPQQLDDDRAAMESAKAALAAAMSQVISSEAAIQTASHRSPKRDQPLKQPGLPPTLWPRTSRTVS
jgi:HlyD family secretion protein